MARVILSVCFVSMLAISTQVMPSRAQLSQKTTIAERIIREEYQPEILRSAPREYLESREADHREAIINRHHQVSRTTDFGGRRQTFNNDASSFSSHASAASQAFPTESRKLSTTPAPGAPNPSQVPALLAFRKALDLAGRLTSWTTSNNCENWSGLTCDSNHYVTQMNLGGGFYTGYVSESIGNLTSLIYIDLAHNQLSGSIPDSFGNLTSLSTLYFGSNQLNGSIPDSIGNMTAISNLGIERNALSGPIPLTLGKLTNLQNLYLDVNQLSGPIPSNIGNLRSLKRIHFDVNHLNGSIPDSIGNMTSLLELFLDNNGLSGDLPDMFNKLTSIQQLTLSSNNLTGTLPKSLSALTNANRINFSNNRFTGLLDASLTQLTSIQTFDISGNYLKGNTTTLQAMRASKNSSSIVETLNCFSDVANQRTVSECELNAYGVTLAGQTSACGGTSNATVNGTLVVGRYYFITVSLGSIYTKGGMQPNNTTITITHSVTGLRGYNGSVNLDGAVITFTNSVSIPTLIHSGGVWLLSLPNNDSSWQIPVFGGGSLVQVLDPTPPTLSYSLTMSSNSVNILGAAWLWSMVQYNASIVASPPLPAESDYNYLQITPKDQLQGHPYTGYFSGQPTNSSKAVNFPYPGDFVSHFYPSYTETLRNNTCHI